MFLAALFLLLLGFALYAVGRRGRRIDLHLVCRACGFDLYRRPETSHRCPECGADTRRRRSMRVGNRRQRPICVAAGLLLGAGGTAMLAIATITWAAHTDWIAWRSVSSLRGDLVAGPPRLRSRASAELIRRIHHGRISGGELSALLDDLLTRQTAAAPGAAAHPWFRQWGDILQAAIAEGRASPAERQRYVDQALRITFAARPRIAARDPVPLAMRCDYHGGTELGPLGSAELRPRLEVTVDAQHFALTPAAQSLDSVVPLPLQFAAALPDAAQPLAPGPHVLHVDLHLDITLQEGSTLSLARHGDVAVQVLAPGESSVDLVPSDEAADTIARNVRVRWNRDAGEPRGWVSLSNPPLPVAMEIRLEQAGHSWLTGRILVRPNDFEQSLLRVRGEGTGAVTTLSGPQPGRAQLVLVPDPHLATGTTDVLAVFSGTVRIPIIIP